MNTGESNVTRPHPRSVYMLPASGVNDNDNLLFAHLVNRTHIAEAHDLARVMVELEPSSRWYQNLGIAEQLLGKLATSERRFHHALNMTTVPAEVSAALTNLAAGRFRARDYRSAHEFAWKAVLARPTLVAPYFVGVATAGRLNDERLQTNWAELIATAMPDFWSRPSCDAFLADPDTAEFRTSSAFRSVMLPLRAHEGALS